MVTAASYLPWMVLSLPAGALVDRYDRAALMWRAQLVQAAVLAAVALLIVFRVANIAVLGVAGLLLGSAEVIFSNAAQAVLPALVPPDLLPRLNGSQQVSLTVGETFLGPPAPAVRRGRRAALRPGRRSVRRLGDAAGQTPQDRRTRQRRQAGVSAPRSPRACAGSVGTGCCV